MPQIDRAKFPWYVYVNDDEVQVLIEALYLLKAVRFEQLLEHAANADNLRLATSKLLTIATLIGHLEEVKEDV